MNEKLIYIKLSVIFAILIMLYWSAIINYIENSLYEPINPLLSIPLILLLIAFSISTYLIFN